MVNDARFPGFLYHYTSFETLALILTNRTICFNSLQNVDDMEEAETADMQNFGKFVYVSCWTDDARELISLWSLYTPDMHGVRIGLPCFPFKKYSYKKGQFNFTEDVTTYINEEDLFREDKYSITSDQPRLVKVEYTDEKSKLMPSIKHVEPADAVERYLRAENMSEAVNTKITISFGELGKYKRSDWEFQHEWRYIITMTPFGMRESQPPTFEKQQKLITKLNDPNTPPPVDRYFLRLADDAVKQMQIVIGPRMTQAEKIYVKTLLKEHGLENNWTESMLRIR